MKTGSIVPDAVLDQPVHGVNLAPGTLRDQLGSQPTLLVFLRQFGCVFCRETLADVRSRSEGDARFPRSIFVFQGSATEGRAFLRRYWPSLRGVADPNAELYDAFGIERAGLVRALGPSVWSAKRRAESKGHDNGERVGDVWRMPGAFLVRDNEVIWSHAYRHAGDLPDYEAISSLCEDLSA